VDDFWKRRFETENQERQSIKRRLRERTGVVANVYLSDSYFRAATDLDNKLRRQLEIHRVAAAAAARESRHPTADGITDALARLK
jgi:hypothetical protein